MACASPTGNCVGGFDCQDAGDCIYQNLPAQRREPGEAEKVTQAKAWLNHCIVEMGVNYRTERKREFFAQADAAIDALILAVQRAEREKPEVARLTQSGAAERTLASYARHAPSCSASRRREQGDTDRPCECGLDALLSVQQSSQEEMERKFKEKYGYDSANVEAYIEDILEDRMQVWERADALQKELDTLKAHPLIPAAALPQEGEKAKAFARPDHPSGDRCADPRDDDSGDSMRKRVCNYGTHKWLSWERDGAGHVRRCRRCPATEVK